MTEPLQHIMIDIETLGTTPQAPIISIGAVFFDPLTGKIGDKNYAYHGKADFKDACKVRTPEANTISWWMTQSDEARERLLEGNMTFYFLLQNFSIFCQQTNEDIIVWGNGATFDISALEDAYRQYGLGIPWKFYNVRDVRTIVDCAQGIVDKNSFIFDGVKHDALDDAKHQAKYVSAMWQALRSNKS